MVVASDGGGSGFGFDESDTNYDSGKVHGGGTGSASDGGLDANSAFESALSDVLLGPGFNIVAGFLGDGVYDKVASAMQKSHPEQLTALASTWNSIATRTNGYASKLSAAITKIGSSWEGDDADRAVKVLQGIHATLNSQYVKSANMSSALKNMGENMKSMKDNFHESSTWGSISNSVTGSDDRNAEQAYKQLMETMKSDLHLVPETVPKQLKSDGTNTMPSNEAPLPHAGGPNGPATSGGPGSSAHVGNPTNPNISSPPTVHPTITEPKPKHPPVDHPILVGPPPTEPPTNNPTYPGTETTYPGGDTLSPYTGGGAGIGDTPGLDTSGSLAGFDGSGAGGAGSLGGGAGAGGLSGSGAGLGGGAGGALGAGAGGAGAGAGAGGALGGGAGGVVGGAAGGRGMMPMHGGHNNDDDERERTTWLNEDDDVWGAEENLPGVIH